MTEGVILFLLSIPVAVGISIYFSDSGTFRLIRDPRYRDIIGEYHLWNYSREFSGTLVRADVSIFKRLFRTPGIKMIYRTKKEEWLFQGSVYVSGDRFYTLLHHENTGDRDPTFIVFEPPQPIWIMIGFTAGFEVPSRPYAGVHLLCDKAVTEADVREILGDDGHGSLALRLDYGQLSARRHTLRERDIGGAAAD